MLFFFEITKCFSQESFSLRVDNDLYFLDDHYYSSGIFFKYGKVINENEIENENFKVYKFWELGQKIYNPSERFSLNTSEYDYPYGGWLYIKFLKQKELNQKAIIQWGVQLGTTGEASLAHWLQNKYHKVFLNISEMPWIDQVPQSLHLNLMIDFFRSFNIDSALKLNSQIYSKVGTQKTGIGIRSGLVFGDSNVLPIGANYFYDKKKGDGLYIGVKTDYIIHDYMVQGSAFRNNTPFNLPLESFRYTIETGFSYHNNKWKFLVMYNQLSRDNSIQPKKSHRILKFTITYFIN